MKKVVEFLKIGKIEMKLVSEIKDVKIMEYYVSFFTFRNNYFYVSLIFILLSLEWFYRKKIGLI